jgi:hypothetical protein
VQLEYCGKPLSSRSKFPPRGGHRCYLPKGHDGKCSEFPFLIHLLKYAPRVAKKIVRDSIMTTGAAWKSEHAGPNRIRRWAMLLSDKKLLELGIDMSKLKTIIVAKLREKAADYPACMSVAQKLTWLAYGIEGCEAPPDPIRQYLEALFGAIVPNTTTCLVCRKPITFQLFHAAQRGKAEIETSHSNPRLHTPDNVGFAHRACNIAQGNKTLEEFYDWIAEILLRVGYTVTKPS